MDLTPYVDRLRGDLVGAAAAGSDAVREAADRLAVTLDPAVRLTLMEALSQAGAEITAEMRWGSVETRLVGRDLDFVVDQPVPTTASGPAGLSPQAPPAAPTPPTPPGESDAEGGVARITVRLPEPVKARAEDLAAHHGQSLNTWIVAALRAATGEGIVPGTGIDLTSMSLGTRRAVRLSGWL